MAKILIGNTMSIAFSGAGKLTAGNSNPVVGATVKVFLYESGTEIEVGGVDWPLVMQDKGEGEYSADLPDTAEIIAGRQYDMVIHASKDAATARWRQVVGAVVRRFGD